MQQSNTLVALLRGDNIRPALQLSTGLMIRFNTLVKSHTTLYRNCKKIKMFHQYIYQMIVRVIKKISLEYPTLYSKWMFCQNMSVFTYIYELQCLSIHAFNSNVEVTIWYPGNKCCTAMFINTYFLFWSMSHFYRWVLC